MSGLPARSGGGNQCCQSLPDLFGYRKDVLTDSVIGRSGPPKSDIFGHPVGKTIFKKSIPFLPSQNESYWDVHDSVKIVHV